MLLLSKRRKLIIGSAFFAFLLLLAGVLVQFYSNRDNKYIESELQQSESELVIQEIEDSINNQVQSQYDAAETSSEKLNARLEFTSLAIRNENYDEALKYAKEAATLEGLETSDKYSAAMNLVNVYGLRGEYELGLNKISEIRADSELMSVEKAEFYVSRFEAAFKDGKVPGPINCIEPEDPGDCPL
jgi:hypothetical protein